jgi:mutator protein MutT
MKRTRSVGVVVRKNSRILLVRHTEQAKQPTGVYGLPAGRITPGETPEEAAVRELREETGLSTTTADLVRLPTVHYSTLQLKTGPEKFSFTVFACRRYAGTLTVTEETIPEWIEIPRLDSIQLLPAIPQIIAEAESLDL